MKSVLALATAATALAAAAAAVAEEIAGKSPTAAPAAQDEQIEAAPRGRGRPKKEEKEHGISDTDRYEKNKELIKPLVEGGQGDAVKKVIKKYSESGLKDVPADKQAAFEKDIDALNF